MRGKILLFRAAIFLAAFLLFLGEPIAAKQLLPVFGGSAAVWMTCLVFFQSALLAGYLYAHALTRGRVKRWQTFLHLALLVMASASAILWAANRIPLPRSTNPVAGIFLTLGLSIGLPFVMLGATSPLLQVWLFRKHAGAVPYRLFALSNLASLLALLAYPTLIEPNVSLSLQRTLWACGVVAFSLVSATVALQSSQDELSSFRLAVGSASVASTSRTKLLWFLLPMAASMQLSAVTAYLTNNIAAIPLLWILPLAVYLLTFILAFDAPVTRYRGILLRFLIVMLAALGFFLTRTDYGLPVSLGIGFFLFEAFLAGLFLHSEAYALRPQSPSETTLFYLILAAGGVAGSFAIGIAAPLLFAGNYDLAFSFLFTALLALVCTWQNGWAQRALWATGSALIAFLVFALHTAYHHQTLVATRNFYGALRVTQSVDPDGSPLRTLLNGSIQHGTQIFSRERMRIPTTYYAENSGIGLALRYCCTGHAKNVGVIGLGAGTLAAYGAAGDRMRFYEINPSVQPIAQNLFTYLRDSPAQITFAEGDARASLAAEAPQRFDVLVIDAFSGDAIPLHLLTVEALAVYRRHLAPGGILAFHVSNQYVDLEPAIAQLAASAGMQARSISTEKNEKSGAFRSTWLLVTDNAAFLNSSAIAGHARLPQARRNLRVWTDNYSSLLPVVHW